MACIKVNENCIGCGSCVSIENDVFDFNDEGYACVKEDLELNDELIENAKDAADACPVSAIEVNEE